MWWIFQKCTYPWTTSECSYRWKMFQMQNMWTNHLVKEEFFQDIWQPTGHLNVANVTNLVSMKLVCESFIGSCYRINGGSRYQKGEKKVQEKWGSSQDPINVRVWQSSAAPLIFLSKAKSRLWPGVVAASTTVACCSGLMTITSRAASLPSAQFGRKISAGLHIPRQNEATLLHWI